MKTCGLDGCEKPTTDRRLVCPMHRNRMKRHGTYDLVDTRSATMKALHAGPRAELIAEIEHQLEAGASAVLLPGRLGYERPASLARRLYRADRPDLAVLFDRVA